MKSRWFWVLTMAGIFACADDHKNKGKDSIKPSESSDPRLSTSNDDIKDILSQIKLDLEDKGVPKGKMQPLLEIGRLVQLSTAKEDFDIDKSDVLAIGKAFCGEHLTQCNVSVSVDDLMKRYLEVRNANRTP